MRLLKLVLFLALVLPSAALAWPPLNRPAPVVATGENDVAIIVAVEDYLMLPDVTGAVKNANDWESFFQRSMKVPEVHVLVNQDATREGMLKFAEIARKEVKPGGRIWWIFIGHGAPSKEGDGLLVGVDAQQTVDSLESRGLPQADLIKALSHDKAQTIMIVDACFSGQSSDGQALATGVQPVLPVKPTALPKNLLVLSAAQSHEVAGALDGVSRPAFSYLLLGAFRGWADDGDGEISAQEAVLYTRRKLRGMKGRQQTPQIYGDGDQVLTTGVSEVEPEKIEPSAPRTEGGNSDAERTLEYMRRRLMIDDQDVARQGDKELDSITFYHEIGRPDLADEFMTHNPYLWVPGIVATGLGITFIALGAANARESTAWFIGGSLGGFFGMAGGITLITLGFWWDYEPLNATERRSAAELYNRELQQKLGLEPGAMAPSGSWPIGSLGFELPGIGVKFSF